MLILIALLACDVGTSSNDDTGADTGAVGTSDVPGGQEGEELIGDTGDVDTDGTDSAALSTSTKELAFGTRLVGCSTEAALTVSNNTGGSVTIDSIEATDEALSVSVQALPLLLDPTDSTTLTIRYAPLREGDLSSTLSVYTDQGLDVEVDVAGQGALYAQGDDAFAADGDAVRFSLTQAAVSATLQIAVDGTPLPAAEWTFSEADSQLTLATPAPAGASVTASYAVQPPSCD